MGFSLGKELVDPSNLGFFLIETIVINGTMTFSSIISNRDDGFGLRRWNFCELKVNRNVTSIRQVRVVSAKKIFENFQQNQQLEIFTFAENFQNDQCE